MRPSFHVPLALALLGAAPVALGLDAADPELRRLLDRLERIEQRLGLVAEPDGELANPGLDGLSARLAALEARLDQQAAEQAELQTKAKAAPSVTVGERGVAARSAEGGFEIRVRGGVHADHRYFAGDEPSNGRDGFQFRRLRPTLEGNFGPLVAFRITPELAGDTASLIDAWIDVNFSPKATLRVGKLKGPVGLERLQSLTTLALIERGFPTELAPNRDVGAQLQGQFAKGRVEYQIGLFNGTPDGRNSNATDADNNPELNARLFLQPWRGSEHALAGLGFGLAISDGEKEGVGNTFLPRYRTPGQEVFFAYRGGTEANGRHRRISPQAYFYGGPLGLQAEYIRSSQAIQIGTDPLRERFTHSAWQITGGWVLTGEKASFGSVVKPTDPFAIGGSGWGAFELVGRYGELSVDDAVFPVFANPDSAARRARAFGFGLNWYLTTNLKLVFNYTHADFDGGAAAGADRPDEKAFFSRIQVAF